MATRSLICSPGLCRRFGVCRNIGRVVSSLGPLCWNDFALAFLFQCLRRSPSGLLLEQPMLYWQAVWRPLEPFGARREELMKSTRRRHESVSGTARGLLRVVCEHRRGAFLSGPVRTVHDDSGSLAITAWTCAACGRLIEEIRILSPNGNTRQRPIRWAVPAYMATVRLNARPAYEARPSSAS